MILQIMDTRLVHLDGLGLEHDSLHDLKHISAENELMQWIQLDHSCTTMIPMVSMI